MVEAVAITGAGAVTPLGSTPALWARYRAGECAAGTLADIPLDALPEVVRTRAARAERVTRLVLAAGGAALGAARLAATEGPARPRIGVVLGTAFGCFLTNAAYQRRLAEGGPAAASPRLFAATVSNAAAGELGIAYRLGGPAVTLSAGAASGLAALGHAADLLRAGRADALVAGGADALDGSLLGWLAASGATPELPPSEAAACVVLETLASATARGADILGTVEGCGSGFEPDGEVGTGLAGAIADALAEAAVAPSDVRCVVTGSSRARPVLRSGVLPAVPDRRDTARAFGETFGAAGPLALLAALTEAPRGASILVVDACGSGHVSALVARRGGSA